MANISITVDMLIFHYQNEPQILLIERKHAPFEGQWALPGGFVEGEETLLQAAERELAEETDLHSVVLNPVAMFDQPGRDPRGRTISAGFWGFITNPGSVKAGDDARNAKWFSLHHLPRLAFDHEQVIASTCKYLQTLYNQAQPLLQGTKNLSVENLVRFFETLSNKAQGTEKPPKDKK